VKERKHYTKESKQGAVWLITDQGRSISDAASNLGIPAMKERMPSEATATVLLKSRKSRSCAENLMVQTFYKTRI